MPNEFLPKIKAFKEQWKEKNEEDLTDDDIISLLDKHLQRDIVEPSDDQQSDDTEKEEERSKDVQSPKDDEIEQISESQKQKQVELDAIYKEASEKLEEINKIVAKIKRKEPPEGDVSDQALTNEQKIKANWFEVDV